MDKITDAIAQAIQTGATVASPLLKWYFVTRMVSDVLSYALPCTAVVIVVWLLCRTIRYCNPPEVRR